MAIAMDGKITIKPETSLSIADIVIPIKTQEMQKIDNATMQLTAGDVYSYNAQNTKDEYNIETAIVDFDTFQKFNAYITARLNQFEDVEFDWQGGEVAAKFKDVKFKRVITGSTNNSVIISFTLILK